MKKLVKKFSTKKRIMVVDDEIDIRQSIKKILEKEGYEVISAINGNACLEKIKEAKPDLILLDVIMEGIKVEELIKKIKNIKILFLSGIEFSNKEKKMLKQKNVMEFLNKPISISNLVKNIKMHLKN